MSGFKFSPRIQELRTLLASDPDTFYAVMEDRDRQLEAYLDLAEEPYTVTWSSSGTQPNPGDTAQVLGLFTLQGRIVDFSGVIILGGAGITAGTGNYFINPPIVPVRVWNYANGTANAQRRVGAMQFTDTTGVSYEGRLFHTPIDGDLFGWVLNSTNSRASATVPVAPATGDSLAWWGRYMVDA